MRLLLVNYEYPPLGGGGGNATMFMSRALARQGHTPLVLTSAFRGNRGSGTEQGVLLHRIRSVRRAEDRSNRLEMLSFMLLSMFPAWRLARAESIDGAIAFFTIPGGPACWVLRRLAGVPYVVSQRGGDVPGLVPEVTWNHRMLTPLRRAILRDARAVVANSRSLAALSERSDPTPVEVIPNGVDAEYFSPGERGGGEEFRMLFVGRFHDQKNLPALFEALAGVSPARPFVLDLVGDGPQRPELEALAARLGIAQRIAWRGWLDKDRALAAYRRADVFVNPSRYEGLPNTVLEAMACALPVIASNIGGNNDLVRAEQTGLLFELDRIPDLRAALERLRDDAALRRSMGLAGRERVIAEYSWDAVARRYVDLFAAADT